jgi:hypothetical protein
MVSTATNNDAKKTDRQEQTKEETMLDFERFIGLKMADNDIKGYTYGFYNMRSQPTEKVPIAEKLNGKQDRVDITGKSPDGMWLNIKFSEGKKYWITSKGIEPAFVNYGKFLQCIKKYEEYEIKEAKKNSKQITVYERITKLRQMSHEDDLPFDDVIGTEKGRLYLNKRYTTNDYWQLLKDFQGMELNNELIDVYHLFVGLDVLQNERMRETTSFYFNDIGSNYSAATWSGDIGAGVADRYIELMKDYKNINEFEKIIRKKHIESFITRIKSNGKGISLRVNYDIVAKNLRTALPYELEYLYSDHEAEYHYELWKIAQLLSVEVTPSNTSMLLNIASDLYEYFRDIDSELMEYYYKTRAPKADLLADIDAWSLSDLLKPVGKSFGMGIADKIQQYYDNIKTNRKKSLEKFFKHYGFKNSENLFSDINKKGIERIEHEIHQFAIIWLKKADSWTMFIPEESIRKSYLTKGSSKMGKYFIKYLQELSTEYGVCL